MSTSQPELLRMAEEFQKICENYSENVDKRIFRGYFTWCTDRPLTMQPMFESGSYVRESDRGCDLRRLRSLIVKGDLGVSQ